MASNGRRPRSYAGEQQDHPGLESKMDPRPKYKAPEYRGADKLHDKVALITGGIRASAGRPPCYSRERARPASPWSICPKKNPTPKKLVALWRSEGSKCLLIAGDVREPRILGKAIEKTVHEFGSLDILVNNAAYQNECDDLESITDEQFERTFHTNIFGYFYMARAALKHLERGSCIINTGSITGLRGSDHLIDYSATKGAIHAFTKSLGSESGGEGDPSELRRPRARVDPAHPGHRVH